LGRSAIRSPAEYSLVALCGVLAAVLPISRSPASEGRRQGRAARASAGKGRAEHIGSRLARALDGKTITSHREQPFHVRARFNDNPNGLEIWLSKSAGQNRAGRACDIHAQAFGDARQLQLMVDGEVMRSRGQGLLSATYRLLHSTGVVPHGSVLTLESIAEPNGKEVAKRWKQIERSHATAVRKSFEQWIATTREGKLFGEAFASWAEHTEGGGRPFFDAIQAEAGFSTAHFVNQFFTPQGRARAHGTWRIRGQLLRGNDVSFVYVGQSAPFEQGLALRGQLLEALRRAGPLDPAHLPPYIRLFPTSTLRELGISGY
jgi:hypothetical protein